MKPNFLEPDTNLPVKNDRINTFATKKKPAKIILISFCAIKSEVIIDIKSRIETNKSNFSEATGKFRG